MAIFGTRGGIIDASEEAIEAARHGLHADEPRALLRFLSLPKLDDFRFDFLHDNHIDTIFAEARAGRWQQAEKPSLKNVVIRGSYKQVERCEDAFQGLMQFGLAGADLKKFEMRVIPELAMQWIVGSWIKVRFQESKLTRLYFSISFSIAMNIFL